MYVRPCKRCLFDPTSTILEQEFGNLIEVPLSPLKTQHIQSTDRNTMLSIESGSWTKNQIQLLVWSEAWLLVLQINHLEQENIMQAAQHFLVQTLGAADRLAGEPACVMSCHVLVHVSMLVWRHQSSQSHSSVLIFSSAWRNHHLTPRLQC